MLILDVISDLGDSINKGGNPKTATVIKAINRAIDKNKHNLSDPEAWKAQKDIILLIMSKIPALSSYSVLVCAIFEIIIQIVEIENVSTN